MLETFYEIRRRKLLGDLDFNEKAGPFILQRVRSMNFGINVAGGVAIAAAFLLLQTIWPH